MVLSSWLARWYDQWSRPVHPAILGLIDRLLPGVNGPWMVPMNGQTGRQELVRSLERAIGFDSVVETGTYRGATSQFFWHVTGKNVITIELNRRFADYAGWRFRHIPDIKVVNCDSRVHLRRLSERASDVTLFYLDAHWNRDVPCAEEVSIITQNWRDAVIIVDDVQVPHDPGYRFDAYPTSGPLCRDYLKRQANLGDYQLMWPRRRSADEGGFCTGAAIMASPSLAELALSTGELVPDGG